MLKSIATHMIKVEGLWEWDEEELCTFVKRKVKEIDSFFSPSTELIALERKKATVLVLVSTLMNKEAVKELAQKWIKSHLAGIEVINLEVEETKAYRDLMEGVEPKYVIWTDIG